MTHDDVADRILTPLWRGLESEYKARYARNIWAQFEQRVRSAAYTDRLERFLQRVTKQLPIAIRADDTERVATALSDADDRVVLKMLREEAAYLVLLVRVANEERRAALTTEAR